MVGWLVGWERTAIFSQKPGNIFLDAEGNVRLGDFGLATRRVETGKAELTFDNHHHNSNKKSHDSIEGVYDTLGNEGEPISVPSFRTGTSVPSVGESITGGVGTTFYRAPEQEGTLPRGKGGVDTGYNVQADIYSLGIILFELFHPPFRTVRICLRNCCLFVDACI